MSAERGHDVDAFDVTGEQAGQLGADLPRPRMQASLVGRHEQDAARSRAHDFAREVGYECGELVLRNPGGRRHVCRIRGKG